MYSYNAESYNPNMESQYLRARYYNVPNANFLTEDSYLGNITDPLMLNRYNYVKSSPLNYIDPSGNEMIVVSGGVAGYEAFKYMFIETALKAVDDMKKNHTDEKITWMISNQGYSETDITNFKKSAKQLGIDIIIMDDKQDFIDYINTKGVNEEERKKDRITQFANMSHGNAGELLWGYNDEKAMERLDLKIDDLKELQKYAFCSTNSWFGSCNTGTDSINYGISIAQLWSNLTGGYTTAVKDGKSDYSHINVWDDKTLADKIYDKLARAETGYKLEGSHNYPDYGEGDAHWVTFIPEF